MVSLGPEAAIVVPWSLPGIARRYIILTLSGIRLESWILGRSWGGGGPRFRLGPRGKKLGIQLCSKKNKRGGNTWLASKIFYFSTSSCWSNKYVRGWRSRDREVERWRWDILFKYKLYKYRILYMIEAATQHSKAILLWFLELHKHRGVGQWMGRGLQSRN